MGWNSLFLNPFPLRMRGMHFNRVLAILQFFRRDSHCTVSFFQHIFLYGSIHLQFEMLLPSITQHPSFLHKLHSRWIFFFCKISLELPLAGSCFIHFLAILLPICDSLPSAAFRIASLKSSRFPHLHGICLVTLRDWWGTHQILNAISFTICSISRIANNSRYSS